MEKLKMTLGITSKFIGRERRKAAGHVGIFCQHLGITAYTLEIIPILKVNFRSTIGIFSKYMIILEIGKMPDLMICVN